MVALMGHSGTWLSPGLRTWRGSNSTCSEHGFPPDITLGEGQTGGAPPPPPVPTPRRDSHHGPLPGDMPKEKTDPRDKPGPVPPSSGQGKTGTGFQQWPKNLKKGITFPRRRRRRSRHRRRRTRRPRTHRTRPRTAGSRERSAQRSLACSSRAAPRRPGG